MDAIHENELISAACVGFPQQPPTEQRRLLHLLLERVCWRAGQLETTIRQPFAALRLSSSYTSELPPPGFLRRSRAGLSAGRGH